MKSWFVAFLLFSVHPSYLDNSLKSTDSLDLPIRFAFINGINVLRQEAKESAQRLSLETEQEFDFVYNATDGFVSDIPQAFAQHISELGRAQKIEKHLVQYFTIGLKLSSLNFDYVERVSIQDEIYFSKFNKNVYVAHSQGNYFANFLCDVLWKKPLVIQVADPSTIETNCEISHVNFKNDPVLNIISVLSEGLNIPGPRTARFNYSTAKDFSITLNKITQMVVGSPPWSLHINFPDDILNTHAFNTYLLVEPSSRKAILAALADLPSPIKYELNQPKAENVGQ